MMRARKRRRELGKLYIRVSMCQEALSCTQKTPAPLLHQPDQVRLAGDLALELRIGIAHALLLVGVLQGVPQLEEAAWGRG